MSEKSIRDIEETRWDLKKGAYGQERVLPFAKINPLRFVHSPVGYGQGIDSSNFASEQLLCIGMSGDSPLIGFILFPHFSLHHLLSALSLL